MKTVVIRGTKDDWGWMGNMSGFYEGKPLNIQWKGWNCLTIENIFQAMRFDDEEIQKKICSMKGYDGKQYAKSVQDQMVVEKMSKQDIKNMFYCLYVKLNTHRFLYDYFMNDIEIGQPIIEDCSKRRGGSGLFWGVAKIADSDMWAGENVLGKCYMELRHWFEFNEIGNKENNPNFQSFVEVCADNIINNIKKYVYIN